MPGQWSDTTKLTQVSLRNLRIPFPPRQLMLILFRFTTVSRLKPSYLLSIFGSSSVKGAALDAVMTVLRVEGADLPFVSAPEDASNRLMQQQTKVIRFMM